MLSINNSIHKISSTNRKNRKQAGEMVGTGWVGPDGSSSKHIAGTDLLSYQNKAFSHYLFFSTSMHILCVFIYNFMFINVY